MHGQFSIGILGCTNNSMRLFAREKTGDWMSLLLGFEYGC